MSICVPRETSDMRAEAAAHRAQMLPTIGLGYAPIKREGWAIAYGYEGWLPGYVVELEWLADVCDGKEDFGS